MNTAAVTKLHPVTFRGAICNGSLDPLLTSFAKLCAVCGHDREQICEAARVAAIRAQLPAPFPFPYEMAQDTFNAFLKSSRRGWESRPELLPGVRTPAQFLVKHGGLNWRCETEGTTDLLRCMELFGGYNNLDSDTFRRALDAFNKRAYHQPGNPNNGLSAFKYQMAREGSPAVYVTFSGLVGRTHVLTRDLSQWYNYSVDDFRADCATFARVAHADESNESGAWNLGGIASVTWRFWWD